MFLLNVDKDFLKCTASRRRRR